MTYIRDQDRARTNLVATLSHELRTPLTSLALSAELLRREDAPLTNPKSASCCEVILEECSRMRQLTDNLLNLARGEIPAIAVQQKRLDLAQTGGRRDPPLRDPGAGEARRTRGASSRSVPEIIGDPVKLSWVISNLLGNALRYTPAGGTIEVAARGTEHATRLEVTDSGPGIPPEMRDTFSSASCSTVPTASRRARRAWGWRLSKRSSRRTAAGYSSRAPMRTARDSSSRFPPAGDLMARLLIVDDEKNIRRSLATFFESLGH